VAAKERETLFERKHTATADMVEKCIGTNGYSSYKNLSEIEFRNVYKLLKDRHAMQKLYLQAELMETASKHIKAFRKSKKQQHVRIIGRALYEKRDYYFEFT
jgi:hypothetical protein